MIPHGILLVLVGGVIGVIGNDLSNPISTSRPLDPLMMRDSGFMKNDTGSSNHYNQTSVPGNKTGNGTIPTPSNFPNSSDPHGNLTRARRNADPLSEYSHKLSTVARISNGISLLAGLINGNIPVDSVIQELLNFGDVKVQDVLALNKANVDMAMDKLESATEGFKVDENSLLPALESHTLALHKMKESYTSIGDFAAFKVPTTYFDDVNNFKTDPTDLGVFADLLISCTNALGHIENIEKAGAVDQSNYFGHAQNVNILWINLKNVLDASDKFQLVVTAVNSFEGLSKPEEPFKPLIQMIEILMAHQTLQNPGKTAFPELVANMNKIKAFSTDLGSSHADLTNIGKLLLGLTHSSMTKRQYTSGFVKGASDLKLLTQDIRDPSVEQTIGTGKNFARLSGGLKPLETLSSELGDLENKLKPTAEHANSLSTKSALNLHSLISNLDVDPTVISTTLDDLSKCQFAKVDPIFTDPINKVIANAKLLATQLKKLKSLAESLPQNPAAVTVIHDIAEQVSNGATISDVQKVLNDLKAATGNMTEVKKHLAILKSQLDGAPKGSDIDNTADTVINGQAVIVRFLSESLVTGATTKLNELKDITGPVGKIAQVVQASRTIRDFKKDDIANIKSAMNTISQASGTIREVQSVPNAMKKNQSEDVKELVAMKRSKETATTLGFAAGSIRNMDGLQRLKASVETLKNDKNFKTEVEKLTEPKKSEIQQKYGDHTALVTALETSLQQISTFKSNLAVEKNLTKLGTPLTAATSVSDVTQNFKEKSEAIGMLISEVTDSRAKTDLQMLKDHMDEFRALDLNFASGHTAFPQVPAALGGLFTFLTDFLTPKRATAAPAAPGTDGSADGGSGMMMLFIGIGLVVAVLIGVAIFAVCYIRKKRTKDTVKTWDQIMYWVDRIYFAEIPAADGFARDLLNEMNKNVGEQPMKTTDQAKMRYSDQKVLRDTAVCLPDGRFINANWIKTQGEAKFIATQGPLDNKTQYKVDTRADFIYMAVAHESEYIVQLCGFQEDSEEDLARTKEKKYLDKKKEKKEEEKEKERERKLFRMIGFPDLVENGEENQERRRKHKVEKTARYYASKKGKSVKMGSYTVKTESLTKIDGCVEVRELLITDSNDEKKEHRLKHIYHTSWEDHSVPDDIRPVITIMETVNKSKKPIIVHCSAGIGRTVAFIGAEVIARDVERHPKKHTRDMFIPLRASRYHGIQTATQAYFAVECALALLINQYAPKETELLEKHLKIFYQVRDRMSDEDMAEMERQYEEYERQQEAKEKMIEKSKENTKTTTKSAKTPKEAPKEIPKKVKTPEKSKEEQ